MCYSICQTHFINVSSSDSAMHARYILPDCSCTIDQSMQTPRPHSSLFSGGKQEKEKLLWLTIICCTLDQGKGTKAMHMWHMLHSIFSRAPCIHPEPRQEARCGSLESR